MIRRSTKRNSPSSRSEVKNTKNAASDSLKGKRRKLGTKPETCVSKSAENTQDNSIYDQKQPKVESSDSSSDELLCAPSDIDLSRFPAKKEFISSDFTAIENNILTGVTRLSDSEDSDLGVSEIKSVYSPHVKTEENVTDSTKVGRRKKALNSNQSKINPKQRNTSKAPTGSDGMTVLSAADINKMDVSQLLALGEGSGTISKIDTSVTDRAYSSTSDLSDWEDVEGSDVKPAEHVIPKEGIEVTLEMPDLYRKRKKKGFDMEAHLRRQLNRIKRELQILIHKVHLLCWISHGRYVNSVLNSEILMAQSLSLIPSQHCYPSKHTNLSYLEKIVEWFKKTVTVTDRIENKPLLPLHKSLEQSFQLRTAYSTRDLVLMFICVLRTLGVKARLILSLQPLPLKPSSQELCSINKTTGKKESHRKKDTAIVKVENTNIRDVSEAATSKKSSKDENECFKSKKSESTSIQQNQKQVDDKCKKSNKKSSNLNVKLKTQCDNPVNRPRNDTDISNEKMDKPKRTLRSRKEIMNQYRDKSDSSEEGDVCSKDTRVACKQKQSPKNRISTPGHPRRRSTVDVTAVDQQKTLSKVEESRSNKGKKTVRAKTNNRGNSSHSADFVKRDENSDNDSDFVPESLSSHKSCNLKQTETADSSSESDFLPKKVTQKKSANRKVLDKGGSLDSGTSVDGKGTEKKKKKKKRNCCDIWTEVFLEEEEKWISVDVQSGKLHCVTELHSHATQPVMYVLAFNNDLTLKDVTRRYCAQFATVTRKLRVDEKWWRESLTPFLTAPIAHDREEDEELNRLMLDRPMPSTLKDFKNHPLYVLKDDLLKFEAIYPPNAPPLGFVRGKPIYSRECVHVLHSREIWMKEAKIVRLGETPYKIVKARPKYDRMTGQFVKDLPLEVFGSWQVDDYVPPPATDGKVPRNEYGNVELYKPCMLPKGTVHLQVPGLNRVARKLGIDCAPAVIGFDYHCGGSHPVLDGFVVCEEYRDILLDAWNQEQDEAEKRQQEKLEKRVYGNWRRLIKGLLIRERLKKRYSFGDEAGPSETKKISSRKQRTDSTVSSNSRKGKHKRVCKRRKIESEEEDKSDDDDDDDDDW